LSITHKFQHLHFLEGESSVVSIVTKLRAEKSMVRIPKGARDLSLLKISDQLWNLPSLILNRYQR